MNYNITIKLREATLELYSRLGKTVDEFICIGRELQLAIPRNSEQTNYMKYLKELHMQMVHNLEKYFYNQGLLKGTYDINDYDFKPIKKNLDYAIATNDKKLLIDCIDKMLKIFKYMFFEYNLLLNDYDKNYLSVKTKYCYRTNIERPDKIYDTNPQTCQKGSQIDNLLLFGAQWLLRIKLPLENINEELNNMYTNDINFINNYLTKFNIFNQKITDCRVEKTVDEKLIEKNTISSKAQSQNICNII